MSLFEFLSTARTHGLDFTDAKTPPPCAPTLSFLIKETFQRYIARCGQYRV